jgi:AcrR family transcriptional regulator
MPRKYTLRRRAEQQAETRQRIVEAAVDLHGSVGPARTTFSMVAERAGVQRHTLYAHFPDERELLLACSAHHLEVEPPPDPAPWAAIADRRARLRTALGAIYGWYERNADMLANVLRDAEHHETLREIMHMRFGPHLGAGPAALAFARRRPGPVGAARPRAQLPQLADAGPRRRPRHRRRRRDHDRRRARSRARPRARTRSGARAATRRQPGRRGLTRARARPGAARSSRAPSGFHMGRNPIGQSQGPRQQAGRKDLAANGPLRSIRRPSVASRPSRITPAISDSPTPAGARAPRPPRSRRTARSARRRCCRSGRCSPSRPRRSARRRPRPRRRASSPASG